LDKELEILLDKMEEVFGVRKLEIKNELFELIVSQIKFPNKNKLLLFMKVLSNGAEKKLAVEGKIFERDYDVLQETKMLMENLEKEYKNIKKNNKSIDEWEIIISTKLTEMGVKYETEDFVLELVKLKKNIILLDDFIIYEKIMRPFDVRIYSYDDINEVFGIIKKEQRTINFGKMYGK
jgi:hypothetical protein